MAWAVGIVGGLVGFLVIIGSFIGYLTNPWTPWQLAGQSPQTIDLGSAVGPAPGGGSVQDIPGLPAGSVPITVPNVTVAPGAVSDHTRYLLALEAGWTADQAVTMTAISIAEDGSGNPTAMSGRNRDGSFDYGLLQINSSHFAECGGIQALSDPLTNFRCGYRIWSRQSFNGWCTYPGGCGGGPGSPVWPQALARAKAAAFVDQPSSQA